MLASEHRCGEELSFGPVKVLARTARDPRRPTGGQPLPKEFELLLLLLGDPYRVFTKEELMKSIWGYVPMVRTRSLDQHASRLRGKLARAGAPGLVVNRWGIGYRLAAGLPGDPTDPPDGANVVRLVAAA